MKISIGLQILFLSFLLNGCQPHQSQLNAPMSEQTLDLEQVPNEVEIVDDETAEDYQSVVVELEDPEIVPENDPSTTLTPTENPTTQPPLSVAVPTPSPAKPTKPQTPPSQPTTKPTTEKSKVSKLIEWAHKTMIEEGQKLGTACNRFVLRVLTKLGFPNISFLANDFDNYAKKYIKNYKTHVFKSANNKAESAELKKIIWSYPERTPFIAQWKRSNNHGHIAVIEKFQDQIIIYQASLNKHTARRSVTTPDQLLNYTSRAHLILYAELE